MHSDNCPTFYTDYLNELRTLRKLSPHTLSAYANDLAELATLAGTTEVSTITHFDIRKFASKLHAKGLNARSIARKLSAWRGFFSWLSEHVSLAANPVDGVKAPKRAKTLPKALSVDDAVRLVSTKNNAVPTDASAQLCNLAMFELLYSSGLRISELVGLDVRYTQHAGYASLGWVDFDAHEVTVTGKGNKMRSVPVGQPAMDALTRWLTCRDNLIKPTQKDGAIALFISARGSRMSPRVVQLRLKNHAQMVGIPVNVHPHVLRHSFASHVLQSSSDLRAVQEMLGHSSITSTQVYTALDFQHLATVYDAAHPRAKKK